jgi:hypothetical protein
MWSYSTTQKNLCQRLDLVGFGERRQKQTLRKQTFEQIPLTFRRMAGKMVYGIMYGSLGSMALYRFIYIRQLPGASVLRLMAFCFYYLPSGSLYLQLNNMCALRCPFGNTYSYKGGALQDYG